MISKCQVKYFKLFDSYFSKYPIHQIKILWNKQMLKLLQLNTNNLVQNVTYFPLDEDGKKAEVNSS